MIPAVQGANRPSRRREGTFRPWRHWPVGSFRGPVLGYGLVSPCSHFASAFLLCRRAQVGCCNALRVPSGRDRPLPRECDQDPLSGITLDAPSAPAPPGPGLPGDHRHALPGLIVNPGPGPPWSHLASVPAAPQGLGTEAGRSLPGPTSGRQRRSPVQGPRGLMLPGPCPPWGPTGELERGPVQGLRGRTRSAAGFPLALVTRGGPCTQRDHRVLGKVPFRV